LLRDERETLFCQKYVSRTCCALFAAFHSPSAPKKDRQENLAGKIQPAIKSEAVSKKSKSSQSWPRTKKLFTYFVLFLVVLGLAARPLRRGALFYQSYWGGAVFVPFLIFIAALILVIAFKDRNGKIRARARPARSYR
jgi:hypothetical protein